MNEMKSVRILEKVAGSIEIPDSTYELAERRYKDLGTWLGRPESSCSLFVPHVRAQGSFRLGTVIRPVHKGAAYDLDLGCLLEKGFSKRDRTQHSLKELLGSEIELYRQARRIVEEKIAKHRCWRLEYSDELKFHLDIVPCIPESEDERNAIRKAMVEAGSPNVLADSVAKLTVNITDDRHPGYRVLVPNWYVSSPEGYARWFESRMRLVPALLEKRLIEARVARIDDLPAFRWKLPLQQCVQILKRHRDIMFIEQPDLAPISIIITTLASRAYQGEQNIADTLRRCLYGMEALISPVRPRVPNPVNPREDFADKWATPEGLSKRLEQNFHTWLAQAKADFEMLHGAGDEDSLYQQALERFGAKSESILGSAPGVRISSPYVAPKTHRISEPPARPWTR